MKKLRHSIWFFLLFVFFPGCITDQKVTTTFSPDGSLVRVVTFKTDKRDFNLDALNIPVDSTWQFTIKKDTADTSRFFVKAEKSFDNVEQLNILYDSLPHNLSGIQRKITWEVKFRWFYTFYEYKEKISALFQQRPMSDFMTEEEIRYALAGDEERDSLFSDLDSTALNELDERVDEKGWKWISACTFDEFYKGLEKLAREQSPGMLTAENLEKAKDSLYAKFDNVEDSAFNAFFKATFGIPDADSLVEIYPEYFKSFGELQDIIGRTFGEEYVNRIIMPGEPVYTNAENITDGVFSWKVGSLKYLGDDFIMEAVTKKPNPWAFYVAIVIVMLAAGLWVIHFKNRS